MFTRKVPLVAAFLCGILLLMAGVAPAWAQSETPTSPDAEPAAAPEAVPSAIDEAPSQYISYQGTLRDSSGNPDNGTHAMSVAIYDNAAASGTALFTQSFSGVQVRNGHFSLLFSGVGPAVFSGKDRFLQLTVDGTALTPTQRLAPVPYAVSSNYANSLAAPDGDPLAPISVNNDGNVTVANPYTLNFGSSTRQMVNLWGTAYGLGVQNYTTYFRADNNFAWFLDGTHSDTALDPGAGGTVAMVLAGGNLGVGTSSPAARLHVATASGNNIPQITTATDNIAGIEYYSNGKRWQLSKRASPEGDELRFYYHDGSSWQAPAVRVKPDGSVNIQSNLTVGSDNHKPIIFRSHTFGRHYDYANWYPYIRYDSWICAIIGFNVAADFDEGGDKTPALAVEALVHESGGVQYWYFHHDIATDNYQDWTTHIMCVDRRLASE